MPETYGYVRTSRSRVSELSGSDPETHRSSLEQSKTWTIPVKQEVFTRVSVSINGASVWPLT